MFVLLFYYYDVCSVWMKSVFFLSMWRTFLSMRKTRAGIVKTLEKERKRISFGMATNSDRPNTTNVIHHFSHHDGMTIVIKMEMAVNNTISIDLGINACWMVLSTKLIFP